MVLFDCQACGACCCNTKKNIALGSRSYVEVLPSDLLFRKRRDWLGTLTLIDDTGTHQLRLTGAEQRCIALTGELGQSVKCTIYELRPAGCRQVEPGDEECLAARRAHPQVRRIVADP